jgi:hypothetical protein
VVPATQAPPPGTSPSPALPLPVLVNITKAKEEARAGSTSLSVGVLVGISVGAAAFVGLIAGGTYAALRSGMGDRCRVSKDAVGRKARQLRPEFLALDVASRKVAAKEAISSPDNDKVGLDSAIIFHDRNGGTTREYCPTAAPAMLLPQADAGLSVELGHASVAVHGGSICARYGPDQEIKDSEPTLSPRNTTGPGC